MGEVRIEACVNSVESALAAQQGGADGVELCENLFDGGTTPSAGSIEAALERLDIDLNVMIRPRGGDFHYSPLELEIMKADVRAAAAARVGGIVFGILDVDGKIDLERSREILDLADGTRTTFHRAYDMTADPFEALDDLIRLGVDRVLTSGQRPSAMDGAELLAELVRRAGDDLVVMPGVGIDAHNVGELVRRTRAREVHVLAERKVQSRMLFKNEKVFMGTDPDQPEFERPVTDPDAIRAIVAEARGGRGRR